MKSSNMEFHLKKKKNPIVHVVLYAHIDNRTTVSASYVNNCLPSAKLLKSFDSKRCAWIRFHQALSHWIHISLGLEILLIKFKKSFCQSTQNWFSPNIVKMWSSDSTSSRWMHQIYLIEMKSNEKKRDSSYCLSWIFSHSPYNERKKREEKRHWLLVLELTLARTHSNVVLFLAARILDHLVIACIQKYYSKLNKYNQLPSKQPSPWRQFNWLMTLKQMVVCSQATTNTHNTHIIYRYNGTTNNQVFNSDRMTYCQDHNHKEEKSCFRTLLILSAPSSSSSLLWFTFVIYPNRH